MTEFYQIELCTDCLVWHANGDTTGIDDPDQEAIIRNAPGIPENYIVSPGHAHTVETCGEGPTGGYEDCPFDEGSFSWSWCDSCQRALGGDRYPANMWDVTA